MIARPRAFRHIRTRRRYHGAMPRHLKTALVLFAAALAASFTVAPLHAQAPDKGKLLVATEDMRDPNYKETVVLLLHHDQNGTIGVAINRPTWLEIGDVQPGVETEDYGGKVFRGGPLAPTQLIFLVRDPPAGAFDAPPILDRIYASGNLQQLEDLAGAVGEAAIRLFAGHSEWSSGQLDREIASGQWIVVDGNEERVFGTAADDMWRRFSTIGSELLVRSFN
jgi:putative transcriptional regulator